MPQGSIYSYETRGERRYGLRIELPPAVQGGKRQQHHRKGFTTRKEAERELGKIAQRARKPGGVDLTSGRKVTVADYLLHGYTDADGEHVEGWIDRMAKLGELRPGTAKMYRLNARRHVEPVIGNVRLVELSPRHVRKVDDKLNLAGYSVGTRRRVRGMLGSALGYAAAEDGDHLIDENPVRRTTPVKGNDAPKIDNIWTPDEFAAFLDHCERHDERLRRIFLVAGRLGLRRGELCGLRWSHVDLDGQVLYVRRSRTQSGSDVFEDDPKSGSSNREVYFDDTTAQVLRAERTQQAREQLQLGEAYHQSGYVVVDEAGQPLKPETLTREFYRITREAGLRKIRLHDLRHGAGTYLAAAGASLAVIRDTLGHADYRMTSLYSHSAEQQRREAAAGVAVLIPTRSLPESLPEIG